MSSLCCQWPFCEDCLYRSLQVAMEDPTCAFNLDPFKIHCSQNSPSDLLSWVNELGEPCSIVFPAILDLHGEHICCPKFKRNLQDGFNFFVSFEEGITDIFDWALKNTKECKKKK